MIVSLSIYFSPIIPLTIAIDGCLYSVGHGLGSLDFVDELTDRDLDGERLSSCFHNDGVGYLTPVHVFGVGTSLDASEFLSAIRSSCVTIW